jgi:hypothetical protein
MMTARTASIVAATLLASSAPTTSEEAIGSWSISRPTSKMDDSIGIIAIVKGSEYQDLFVKKTPSFIVRCVERSTAAYLDLKTYIHLESRTVRYRLDTRPAKTETWRTSTDYEAVGLWRPPESIAFVRSMVAAQQLLIRVQPAALSPLEMTFDIAGIDQVAKEISSLCKWPSQPPSRSPTATVPAK